VQFQQKEREKKRRRVSEGKIERPYVQVCIYIFMCIYIYINLYVIVHICVYINKCICICIYMCRRHIQRETGLVESAHARLDHGTVLAPRHDGVGYAMA